MQTYSKMDIGLMRRSNQDAYRTETLSDGTVLAVVCDGMGGANAGNVASENAVTAISDFVCRSWRNDLSPDAITSLLQSAIRSANIIVYDMAKNDSALEGMGTTVVAAIVRDGDAVIAHVGDSRAYLVTGGEIRQLTRDHSVVQNLIESGKLTPEEARVHPRKNVITRALGTEENILADDCEVKLNTGDTIMLCTDGLTNFVDVPDMLAVFGENDIKDVAEILIQTANQNGGGDNITVVTVTVTPTAAE